MKLRPNRSIFDLLTLNGRPESNGVFPITGQANINLYPNPNNGSFILQSGNSIGEEYIISDMIGRVVARQTITSDNQNIELQNITPGSYILLVKGNSSKAIRFTIDN